MPTGGSKPFSLFAFPFSIQAALLAAALVLFFVDLGGSAIWDANEAFYVETPREMIERGDYVLPTFNYEPRVNKPVLSYWIVAGFYKAFGVSVALPGLVFFIYLLAHRELRRVTQMMIPAGVAIVLAIVVPWYAALYRRDGWTHIASFFVGENIGRFSDGIGVDTDRGPFFY